MQYTGVIVLGAGAAGLMAAHALSLAGEKVTILEARGRCGGRIHTLTDESGNVTELGAEFIHGDLPVTIGLLKHAGIGYHVAGGEMWRHHDGRVTRGGLGEEWDVLAEKLRTLKTDVNVNLFLSREFPGDEYHALKDSVRRFASGYDSADPDRASTFALRGEWLSEDEGAQYRIDGGYGSMIACLEREFIKNGGQLMLNTIVSKINWHEGGAEAETAGGKVYRAAKIIIAVPLGILQIPDGEKSGLVLNPPVPEYAAAFQRLGFGAVVKVLLKFDDAFWLNAPNMPDLSGMGFMLSDEEIPTWWTQAPQQSGLLTGWLGGPVAGAKKGLSENEILQQSLQSLSAIFKTEERELRRRLLSYRVMNWTCEPYTLGSYAYDTVESAAARGVLIKPIAGTVYFAGEYLYEGVAMGTVEAALASGATAAKEILAT